MFLRSWEKLPDYMRNDAVKPYYDILNSHRVSLAIKRLFDIVVSLILIIVLCPFMLIIALIIKFDSPGPVFFSQIRVTIYGKLFKIKKFRTMVNGAEKKGAAITVKEDARITKVGKILRNTKLDELPQLFNILLGDMSFVGTRPEVVKYVEKYQPKYYATLLMPAGVTSEASIRYKNENKLLDGDIDDVDIVYLEKILPAKMALNLESVETFRFHRDVLTMIRTVLAVLGKQY